MEKPVSTKLKSFQPKHLRQCCSVWSPNPQQSRWIHKEIFMNCCNTLNLILEIFTPRIYYIHLNANVSQSSIQGQSHLSKDFAKWEWELFFYSSIIYATKHFFSHACIFIYFSKLVCDVHWVLSYPSKSNFGNELIQLNIITKA